MSKEGSQQNSNNEAQNPSGSRTELLKTSELKADPLLAEFTAYCKAHPSLRFWQALRNWSGYHWTGRDGFTHDDTE